MNIQVSFEKAGRFNLMLDGSSTDMTSQGLLVAHIWNMDAWAKKATKALELYTRDRARNDEENIGNRCVYKTCDDLAYLHQDIRSLKEDVRDIMTMKDGAIDRALEVCDRFTEMQSFLQAYLWTDQPKSHMDFSPVAQVA